MKKSMVYAGLLLLLFACSNKKLPAGIIPADSMKLIIWDMLRADQLAVTQSMADTGKIKKDYHLELYQQVFTIHHTTRDEFYKSYRYYLAHPDINKVLNDSLTSYGERKRVEQYMPKKALQKE